MQVISKRWNSQNKYVDFYYYPGDTTTVFDFIDMKDRIATITANTGKDKLTVAIPVVSYKGSIKIFSK